MKMEEAINILKNAAFLATTTESQTVEEAIITIIDSLEKQTSNEVNCMNTIDNINNMSAIEYLTTKKRMCDKYIDCNFCPLTKVCGRDNIYPNEAIKIVSKWEHENPIVTNADKILEVFGKVMLSDMTNDNWLKKEYKEPTKETE